MTEGPEADRAGRDRTAPSPSGPGWRLSAFADEISPDPRVQIDSLLAQGIGHLELRGVWDTGVLNLDKGQIREFRSLLEDAGVAVSSIGSPVGKVPVHLDPEGEFQRLQVAVERAHQFGCRYVRVFSFYHPGEPAAACRSQVIDRLRRMAEYAASAEVILLHENEKDIFGDVPERCVDLLRSVDHPHLGAVFDPANFIQCGVDPLAQAWPMLQQFVRYFHIKDAVKATGRVVPAGHGDAGLAEILRRARRGGFRGFLSLEPHLAPDDPEFGGDGPTRFRRAVEALKAVLEAP